jgi:hypothetical protein
VIELANHDLKPAMRASKAQALASDARIALIVNIVARGPTGTALALSVIALAARAVTGGHF